MDEREKYIKLAFTNHLSDSSTYKQLTEHAAESEQDRIREKLSSWLKKANKYYSKTLIS